MNSKIIKVKRGNIFKISVESNPTTGYQWEVNFDPNNIKLENRTYVSSNSKLGSGGREHFTFKSLNYGNTKIIMQYRRSWELKAIKKEKFIIEII